MGRQLHPGDITIIPLPRGFGYVYGRVIDDQATGHKWAFLGTASQLDIACGFACIVVDPGRQIWIFDENGMQREYVCRAQ
jgi:hypothetical protein